MSLLVLAYPEIEKKDFEWIQKIRAKHDERYFNIVNPHFTLVFPVFNTSEKILTDHINSVKRAFKEFYFVLRCSQIVKDSFSDYTDIMLIPEEGYRIFVKLHDALYTGPLEHEQRLDIPFIPHMTIGNNLDPYYCKRIADHINKETPEIVGAVNKLDIVSFENHTMTSLQKILL